MSQSVAGLTLSPLALLVGALVVACAYALLGLALFVARPGRTRAVGRRLTRTAALPAVVGVGAFAFAVTSPPGARGLMFSLSAVAVVLAVLAAPVLAVTLALDSDGVE
jgi:cytochrome bd-type quinol oxidase subunit 2